MGFVLTENPWHVVIRVKTDTFLICPFHFLLLHIYHYRCSNERHHQSVSAKSKEIAPSRYIQLAKHCSAAEDLCYDCASVRICKLNRLFPFKPRYAIHYTIISVINTLPWKLFADIGFHDPGIALWSTSTDILDARINFYIIDVLTSQQFLHEEYSI